MGASVLHYLASNENRTPDVLMQLLSDGVDMNARVTPQTKMWYWIFRLARWSTYFGTENSLLLELAELHGCTPLIIAARYGKVAEVREMLDMAADPALRNGQGRTALDLVRRRFG